MRPAAAMIVALTLASVPAATSSAAEAGASWAQRVVAVSYHRDGNAAAHAGPGSCTRPYAATGPWNIPIGRPPRVHPRSSHFVASLQGVLTSDPTQYTYPVYEVSRTTTARAVSLSGHFSRVTGPHTMRNQKGGIVRVPIPDALVPAEGSDGQVILLNPLTGDEWGFWRLERRGAAWRATNGYHYNARWSGVPPSGFVSRGAGIPYLAGLVRPCEIARGRIDHALAFAYDYPSPQFVYPATKSDGKGNPERSLPEGARLQLDPSVTRAQLVALGVTGPALTIAQALQRYGMYVTDASGREKVMMEYEETAHWNGRITAATVNRIPLERFRWVVVRR